MFSKIFLVGFRTTGKTTIGKILADKLNWSFLDMDFLITQEAGKDAQALTKNGTDWEDFRKIENEVLYEISKAENVVISCGGGVGVNDIKDKETGKTYGELNKKILEDSEDSLVILLISSEKSIKNRLRRQFKNNKIMPFLNQENAKSSGGESNEDDLIEKQIEDSISTYKQRMPLYDMLTKIRIDTDKSSLEETAQEIIKYVK